MSIEGAERHERPRGELRRDTESTWRSVEGYGRSVEAHGRGMESHGRC